MGSSSKRQQTAAKRAREHAVKERRALKQEKKQATRAAKAAGEALPQDVEDVADGAPESGDAV
jgi:hypothetical protein